MSVDLMPAWAGRLLRFFLRDETCRSWIEELDELSLEDIARGEAPCHVRRRYYREATVLLLRGAQYRFRHRFRSAAGRRHTSGWWLGDGVNEVWLAARRLGHAPILSTSIVATLAVGVGGTAALLSVVHALWWVPLPFPDSEQIVVVWRTTETNQSTPSSYLNVADLRESAHTLDAVTGFVAADLGLRDEIGAERVTVGAADAAFFGLMGTVPILGRTITAADNDVEGGRPVVVLSEGLWRSRYSSDPEIVGKQVRLEGERFEVIGVVGFADLSTASTAFFDWDMWWPVQRMGSAKLRRVSSYVGLARIAPDATFAAAAAEAAAIGDRLAAEYPETNAGSGLRLVPLREEIFGALAPPIRLLFTGAALVLLIALFNVSGLLLARAADQTSETAVRRALGASTGNLARQQLAEAFVLAATGCGLGLGLGSVLLRLFIGLSPVPLPTFVEIRLASPVVVAIGGLTFIVAALIGALPVLSAARVSSLGALPGTRTILGAGVGRLRTFLTASEIAAALIVLVAAGLLGRSFGALTTAGVGFDAENLLLASVPIPRDVYPDSEQAVAVSEMLAEQLAAIPGVHSASIFGSGTPGYSGLSIDILPGETDLDDASMLERAGQRGRFHRVSAGWLEDLGLRIQRGRGIERRDRSGERPVVVLSASLAEALWPGADAIGRSIHVVQGVLQPGPAATVIGIVADAQHSGRVHRSEAQLREAHDAYFAWPQQANHYPQFLLRTEGDPDQILPLVRATIASVDAGLALGLHRTVEAQLAREEALPRFLALLMAAFSGLAATLVGLGLYGVLGHALAQRRREIGLRAALGATPGENVLLLLAETARIVIPGVALGLVGAWFLGRVLTSLLFEVSAHDPISLVLAPLALLAIGAVASLGPGLKAVRISPVVALED